MTQCTQSLALAALLVGCGKSDPSELCDEFCGHMDSWASECSDGTTESDAASSSNEECISECTDGADEASEEGCSSQWTAYYNCMNDLGIEDMTCEPIEFAIGLATSCTTQMSALLSCMPAEDDDSEEDTGGL